MSCENLNIHHVIIIATYQSFNIIFLTDNIEISHDEMFQHNNA